MKYQDCDYRPLGLWRVHVKFSSRLVRRNTYASFSCFAWVGDSMPSVVHTSMSILRISRTISRIRSKPRFLPARSLHAAPMQKRVLPFSFALRAASNTGSTSRRREALVSVVYLDDCEQYEPGEHKHGPAWRLWGRSHSLRYSLHL